MTHLAIFCPYINHRDLPPTTTHSDMLDVLQLNTAMKLVLKIIAIPTASFLWIEYYGWLHS